MKNAVIITGIAGMLGSTLLKKYLKKNIIIIGIDNLTSGKKKFIKKFLSKKNFYFFKHDLSKKKFPKKLNNTIRKFLIKEIWALAANSDINSGIKNVEIDLHDTFLTTFYTLNNLKLYINSKTKIIFSSSSAIYGEKKKAINEQSVSDGPRSNYGVMKSASELYIAYFSRTYNIHSYIYRFPNVIGDNLTHGVVYDLHKKLKSTSKFLQVLGNGQQQKPYSHVDEIINCMIYIKKRKFINKVNYFNIGTNDKGIKVKEIVKILQENFNKKKKNNISKKNKRLDW